MRIIAELPPSISREVLINRIKAISQYTSYVDIPDSPMGKPSAHAIAVGVLAKEGGLAPIVHMRLRDLNLLAYRSLLGAMKLLGLEHVVLLMGDPPSVGLPVDHLSTESAVPMAKEYGLRVGVMVSMRRNYAERLKIGADFFLVLNLETPSSLEGLESLELYPYLIIRTDKNSKILERLGQPSVELRALRSFIEELEPYVDGAIISAPGDFEAELTALALATRR